jgi:4-hydroxyacetophenone monooxygenase
MSYIITCLADMIENGWQTIEPTQTATAEWHRKHQAEINTMVWAHPAIEHSYFKNPDGEIHTVSPWRLPVYWNAVRTPDWSNFVVTQGE